MINWFTTHRFYGKDGTWRPLTACELADYHFDVTVPLFWAYSPHYAPSRAALAEHKQDNKRKGKRL